MKLSTAIGRRILPALIAIAIGAAGVPAAAQAGVLAEESLLRFGETGSGAGQLRLQGGGIAADESSGHVFVADVLNNRISEFTAWGEFVKAWGWGVADGSPEPQTCGPAQPQLEPDPSLCRAGLAGGGTGQLLEPTGIAVSPGGDIYVYERANHRLQVFGPDGGLKSAIGGDVVASGPGDSSVDEEQEITVAATSGTFRLSFADPRGGGQTSTTADLPFDASAAEVEAALDGLATISGHGGSVAVTGGPGDATGSSPYVVTFEGALEGDDVPTLEIDRSGLGAASIGARLVCSSRTEADSYSYQWLRNGVSIPGATSPTYVTTAADESKVVQCLISTQFAEAGMAQATNPVYVAPPAPATAPPVAPEGSFDPSGHFPGPVQCGPDGWQGATSFAYRWYRNGAPIPGATSSTYAPSAAELAEPAVYQCAVTGSNAGGATTKLSRTKPTPVPPTDRVWWIAESPHVGLEPVLTLAQGGGPERCLPLAGDDCKPGRRGTAGGEFALETPPQLKVAIKGDNLDIVADGTVYVGDWGRIQALQPDGSFAKSVPLSRSLWFPALPMPQALDVEPVSGDFFVTFRNPQAKAPDSAYRLSATGAERYALPIAQAPALATAPGGIAFAPDRPFDPDTSNLEPWRLREFGNAGQPLDSCCELPPEQDVQQDIPAMATNVVTATEGIGLYVAHQRTGANVEINFVEVFGAPPANWPAPPNPPEIEAQFAKSVGEESASLAASINPNFWADTHYRLEYGTAPCGTGGCQSTTERQLGGGVVRKPVDTVGVTVSGLQPDTTYHYRFVTESGGGGPVIGPDETFTTFAPPAPPDSDCPNQGFRTGLSATLPDCRAYEMVSPVDKAGGDILVQTNINSAPARLQQAASSGEAITYSSYRSFGDNEAAPYTSQYVARRGAEGWSSEGISAPQRSGGIGSIILDSNYRAFNDDLSIGWLAQETEPILAPGAALGYQTLYRRDVANGGYEALSTTPIGGANNYRVDIQGSSEDGSRTFFNANGKQTANAANITDQQIYEAFQGKLRLVSVKPNGSPATVGSSLGTYGGPFFSREVNVATAVSEDGSRAYWSENNGPVYVRVNAVKTVPVSKATAQFWAAKPDGSQAIYTEAGALKLFSLESESSTTLAGAGVEGVLGQSDDLTRVYFTSSAVLADGAVAGEPNLYLYEAGEALRLVATLAAIDRPAALRAAPVDLRPEKRLSRVSADGGVAVFMSRASLTGADNIDQKTKEAVSEVFRYDADSAELRCVSCSPTGEAPQGTDLLLTGGPRGRYASRIPTWELNLYAPRVIAAGGERIFFGSLNRLVVADTNGHEDVYEWEAPGTGSCSEDSPAYAAVSGGCIFLISSGRGEKDAEFVDASADGRDAFFLTSESLVAWDPAQIDLYDAREGGGLPPPPEPAPACEGEACQGQVKLPAEPSLASQSFQGAGNPRPGARKACRKGFVRRHGKCVRKKGGKHRRAHGKQQRRKQADQRRGAKK